MSEGDNMEKHLQTVQSLKQKCEEQGKAISDNIYIAILLNSISEEYKIAVTILESQEQLTLASIINYVMEEYHKNSSGSSGSLSKIVMVMLTKQHGKKQSKYKSSPKGKSSSKDMSSPEQCDYYQRQGHNELKYWIKHLELHPMKSSSRKGSKKVPINMIVVSKNPSTKIPIMHWYLDSESSDHFSPYEELFDDLEPLTDPIAIDTAKGVAYGIARGRIQLSVKAGDEDLDIILNNVLYGPNMQSNLLSMNVLYDLSYEISMKPSVGTRILRNSKVIVDTVQEGKLFRLTIPVSDHKAMIVEKVKEEEITIWHHRMEHLGTTDVQKLKKLVEGIKIRKELELRVCGDCLTGKQHHIPSHELSLCSENSGGLIYNDINRKIEPTALGGFNYYSLFIDDIICITYFASMKTTGSAEIYIYLKLLNFSLKPLKLNSALR
jgi:hypothetical protein